MDYKSTFYYDETSPTFLRWKVDIFCGRNYSVKLVSKGDIAGSLHDSSGYARVKFNKKNKFCHSIIWELFNGNIPEGLFIDHIDGDKLNNNVLNLRIATRKQNLQNSAKSKNNTTGVTGIYFQKTGKEKFGRYIAQVQDLNGKPHRKSFSISKLGEELAFFMACEYRE